MATRPWPGSTITRRAPRPPDGILHVTSDTHFGLAVMESQRKKAWSDDLDRLGMNLSQTGHVILGDVTDGATTTQDAEAVTFFNSHFGAGQWAAAVGNHDLFGSRVGPDAAASAWGMPAANYVVDHPFCRIIFVCPDDLLVPNGAEPEPFTTTRLNWIAAQAAATSKPVLIACHWSLYGTIGYAESGNSQYRSVDLGWYATQTAEIMTMLADVPNIKGWLSGHTHTPFDTPTLHLQVDVGGRPFAAINASAISYTGKSTSTVTGINSLYVFIENDELQVYHRNHGAGLWVSPRWGVDPVWRMQLSVPIGN